MDEIEMLKQKQAELKNLKQQTRKPKKPSRFKGRFKNIVKTKEEIQAWEKVNKEAVAPAQPVQLDLFTKCSDDENCAAMPNTISRSALFAPVCRGRRRFVDNEIIASRHDIIIMYEGKQLDIGDSDVFMQAIRLADQKQLGTEFQIQPYAFLNELGRSGNGRTNKEWLMHSLQRLKKGNITIKTKRYTAILSLIDEYIYNEDAETHYLRFNPKIMKLFRQEQYGLIDWQKRKEIGVDLGKWLQTYIASNKTGEQKVSIKKIKEWSGQKTQRMDRYKKTLQKAILKLEKLKIIKDAQITENNILKYTRL